jgi:hypothetical protein
MAEKAEFRAETDQCGGDDWQKLPGRIAGFAGSEELQRGKVMAFIVVVF